MVLTKYSVTKMVIVLLITGAPLAWFYWYPSRFDSWEAFYASSRYARAWPWTAAWAGPVYVVAVALFIRTWVTHRGAAISYDGETLTFAAVFVERIAGDEIAAVEAHRGEGRISIIRKDGGRLDKRVSMMEGTRAEIIEKIRGALGLDAESGAFAPALAAEGLRSGPDGTT